MLDGPRPISMECFLYKLILSAICTLVPFHIFHVRCTISSPVCTVRPSRVPERPTYLVSPLINDSAGKCGDLSTMPTNFDIVSCAMTFCTINQLIPPTITLHAQHNDNEMFESFISILRCGTVRYWSTGRPSRALNITCSDFDLIALRDI